MTILYNIKRLTSRRQELRRSMPPAEVILWRHLKGRQFSGYKWRRQYGVGGYVLDFYCPDLRLAIEVDGPSHFVSEGTVEYDQQRQRYIESIGITIIRVTNETVYRDVEGVLKRLGKYM